MKKWVLSVGYSDVCVKTVESCTLLHVAACPTSKIPSRLCYLVLSHLGNAITSRQYPRGWEWCNWTVHTGPLAMGVRWIVKVCVCVTSRRNALIYSRTTARTECAFFFIGPGNRKGPWVWNEGCPSKMHTGKVGMGRDLNQTVWKNALFALALQAQGKKEEKKKKRNTFWIHPGKPICRQKKKKSNNNNTSSCNSPHQPHQGYQVF